MPKSTISVKVGTTPVRVLAANPLRLSYAIVNAGSAVVYLGAADGLTTDQGEPLQSGAMVSDDTDKEDVYAVAASSGQDLRVTDILKEA